MYYNAIGFNFGLVFFVLVVFGVLRLLNIPTGSFIDWAIAVAIFEWLLVIVTVPWNIHFEAKEVIADASGSEEKGIEVDSFQVEYAKTIAERSLKVAIILHVLSAIGFYALAVTGISILGYVGSGAALLLTVLRPAVRTYEYLAARLAAIRQEFKYPRFDIVELRDRFNTLEATVKRLEEQMNPENPLSWVTTQQQYLEAIRNDLTRIASSLEQLKATNDAEHQRLERSAQEAIAELSTDGQFLDRVREIIRFFKTA